jgi:phosphate/sulfate permease
MVASRGGLPVSTTHSAVGGVIAFAVASKGWDSVKWDRVG